LQNPQILQNPPIEGGRVGPRPLPDPTRDRENAEMMREPMTLAVFLLISSVAAADDYTPYVSLRGTPHALEPVVMEAHFEACNHIDKVEFSEGVFNVVVEPDVICLATPPEGLFPEEFTLGALPVGTYRARLIQDTAISSEMMFTVAPPKNRNFNALSDYSGIWWDPNRSGESIFVEHETGPDKLLLVWNTYDEVGNPQWLVGLTDPDASDDRRNGYSLILYRPSPDGMQRVGVADFVRVYEKYLASLRFQFTGGESTTIPLRRFVGDRTQTYANKENHAFDEHGTTESPIAVSGRSGNASNNAAVTVDIRHPRRGDLQVDLVAPDGSLYNIHGRSNDSAGNVFETRILDLSSEAFNGTWKLRARDATAGEAGYIDRWSITF
jgi:hypothetical protein